MVSETESVIELRCGCGASLFVKSYWLPGVESSTIERFQMEHRCWCEGDGELLHTSDDVVTKEER